MQFLSFEVFDSSGGGAIPSGRCTVYLTGTSTLAALFNASGGSIGNPMIAAGDGIIGFAAADGVYDFQLANADGSLNGPRIPKVQLFDLSNIAAPTVATRTALAAISATSGMVRYLSESGREGWFKFNSANLSASVTADPQQGVYVPPAAAPTGASGAWVRVLGTLKPSHFGAVGDGATDDTVALQAYWTWFIANNPENDCSGNFAISSTITIGPSSAPAVVPAREIVGRMRVVALNAITELVRRKNIPYRRWVGGIETLGTGATSFASRTCLIGVYDENCSRLETGFIQGQSLALGNHWLGTVNNNCMRTGKIVGNNIGSGYPGQSLTGNWTTFSSTQNGTTTNASAVITGLTSTTGMQVGFGVSGTGIPANATILSINSSTQITLSANATASGTVSLTITSNSGSSNSTAQRTVINADTIYAAAIDAYLTVGTDQIQLRIGGYLYYVYAFDRVAGTASIYPWLDNTLGASGTYEWVIGGNYVTKNVDNSLSWIGLLDGFQVGRNLSEGGLYGTTIEVMQTNGAGTMACLGRAPSAACNGTIIKNRYIETTTVSEEIVVLAGFGASNWFEFLGDSGSSNLAKCWNTSAPRASTNAIIGGGFGASGGAVGSATISKFGRPLPWHKNNLGQGPGSTLALAGQARPPDIEAYNLNTHNLTLQVLGAGEYNRLQGYNCGYLCYVGTGTNAAPTGSFVFTPPSGGTINGGSANATATFSGPFDGPVLFQYLHTDAAQLTWIVRVLTGQSRLNIAALGYSTGAGGVVTQLTSRTTGVILNKLSGQITLLSAAGSASFQSFTLTNSQIAATDTLDIVQASGTDLYQVFVTNVVSGSCKISFATTGGTTVEQPVFNFSINKGANA